MKLEPIIPEKRTYVDATQYDHDGFETRVVVQVRERDPIAVVKYLMQRDDMFMFFDAVFVRVLGQEFRGPQDNFSPRYFPGGARLTVDELVKLAPRERELGEYLDREYPDWIRTRNGIYLRAVPEDVIL